MKEYQTRTLDAFTRWSSALDHARNESLEDLAYYESRGRPACTVPGDVRNYPKSAWTKLAQVGEVAHGSRPYNRQTGVDRTAATGFPIPHVCFKVPTGGGKTLLGAAALEQTPQPEQRPGAVDGPQQRHLSADQGEAVGQAAPVPPDA